MTSSPVSVPWPRPFIDRATDWLVGATGGSNPDPIRVLCPFCGLGCREPCDRCPDCGSVPVVSPDDRRVYETVLANCGPACDHVGDLPDASADLVTGGPPTPRARFHGEP